MEKATKQPTLTTSSSRLFSSSIPLIEKKELKKNTSNNTLTFNTDDEAERTRTKTTLSLQLQPAVVKLYTTVTGEQQPTTSSNSSSRKKNSHQEESSFENDIPSKKRKTSSPLTAPPIHHTQSLKLSSVPPPPFIPTNLVDTHIVKTVHDLLGLLQLYGPLTQNQLEFFLTKTLLSSSLLKDILDLLVTIGTIQTRTKTEEDLVVYFILGKTIATSRPDVTLPQQVLSEIEKAHSECRRSLERTKILKDYLQQLERWKKDRTTKQQQTPRELLLQMMESLYNNADMINDPVYATAMRTFGIATAGTILTTTTTATTTKKSNAKKKGNAKRSTNTKTGKNHHKK